MARRTGSSFGLGGAECVLPQQGASTKSLDDIEGAFRKLEGLFWNKAYEADIDQRRCLNVEKKGGFCQISFEGNSGSVGDLAKRINAVLESVGRKDVNGGREMSVALKTVRIYRESGEAACLMRETVPLVDIPFKYKICNEHAVLTVRTPFHAAKDLLTDAHRLVIDDRKQLLLDKTREGIAALEAEFAALLALDPSCCPEIRAFGLRAVRAVFGPKLRVKALTNGS